MSLTFCEWCLGPRGLRQVLTARCLRSRRRRRIRTVSDFPKAANDSNEVRIWLMLNGIRIVSSNVTALPGVAEGVRLGGGRVVWAHHQRAQTAARSCIDI